MDKHRVASAPDLPQGTLIGDGGAVVGNNGSLFGVSRKCRHLGADLATGSLSPAGCLVCPWHQSEYDVTSGRMVVGPQGIFAKIPGLGAAFKALTAVIPLKRFTVTQEDNEIYIS